MLIGAHMSVAGGVDRSVARGLLVGCRTMQIFTKNANQWIGPSISREAALAFRKALQASAIAPVVSHDSYLINLASPDRALRAKSLAAFTDELRRADQLGLLGVVTHPGAHVGAGEEDGLARVADGFVRALQATKKSRVLILIENTAGQGTCLGHRFEHLSRLIELAGGHDRLGVCLDTCHLHAAGFEIHTAEGLEKTVRDADRILGMKNVKLIHANDSKTPLGSRVDRHENIGQGHIGKDGFRRILAHPKLKRLPFILETPVDQEGDDVRNLETLKKLCPKSTTITTKSN